MLVVLPVRGKRQQQAKVQQETLIKGRVLAWSESLVIGSGLGPSSRVFVFGIESATDSGKQLEPVKILYAFFKDRGPLPDSFYDYSKRYELKVVRDPKCDENVNSLSREKAVDESGKELQPTDSLRFLDGSPRGILKPDRILPCYVLRPGGYGIVAPKKE